MERRERYRGTLVGVLAGDALGAPYETWAAERVRADLEKRGGLVLFDYPDPFNKKQTFPKGRPTDDSDQMAALAQSIIEMRGVDETDMFHRFRRVTFDHHSLLWEGKAYGAGKTTRDMLRPTTWEGSRSLPSTDAFPSNGSLMRSAPLALYFGSFGALQRWTIHRVSMVTHRHHVAGECCVAYVAILTKLLHGADPEDAIAHARPLIEAPEVLDILRHPKVPPRDPEAWPGRGAAVLTLHAALWSLLLGSDFRDGITRCVSLGGDTDTYAAVAGGLLGALYGLEGIPDGWREVLLGRARLEAMADRLYDIALS